MKLGTYKRVWLSIEDMIRDCTDAHRDGRRESLHGGSFVGRKFNSWDEVVQAAKSPWPEGLDAVDHMRGEVEEISGSLPAPKDRRRRRVTSPDTGDDIDLDRLRGGQDYWWRTHRQLVTAPQNVTLVTNESTHCGVDADKILWRGVAGIVLCDLLERRGYSVELWTVNWTSHGYKNGDDTFFALRLKEAGSPLDPADVVNAVSGWFFRTVFFQAYHTRADVRPTYTLGRPNHFAYSTRLLEELRGPNSTLVVIDDVWSLDQAVSRIRSTIDSLNEQTVS